MTLYRKSKDLQDKAKLKLIDQAEAFELRLIDDDSDLSDYEGVTDFFIPSYEMPPLDFDQEIGEFDSLVLVNKKNYDPSKYN